MYLPWKETSQRSFFQLTSQFRPEQAAAVATLLFSVSFVLVLITERLVHRRRDVP